MLPFLTVDDSVDLRYAYAVLIGQASLCPIECLAYRDNLLRGKFGIRVPFPVRRLPVALLISRLGCSIAPPKIFKAIVGTVAVPMAALHAWWARSNKANKHQAVNTDTLLGLLLIGFVSNPNRKIKSIPSFFAALPQDLPAPSLLGRDATIEHDVDSWQRLHAPEVGHLVVRESRNVLPAFARKAATIITRHGVISLVNVVFRGLPGGDALGRLRQV